MKKIIIIIISNFLIGTALQAMNAQEVKKRLPALLMPSSNEYRVPEYAEPDQDLQKFMMDRQGWKPLTRSYMQTHPENEAVQKLYRYLKVISMKARNKMPANQSISLVQMVEQDPDATMYGCAERDYIDNGKIKNCFYPMGGIDEHIWKRDYLPKIEEQIARCASEKQNLPGHGCLQ